MHEILVNRLGGLSLPRKSVVRLTDRPDMTLDAYRGRKTITALHTHSISLRNLFLIARDIESLRENNQTQNKDPWRAERFFNATSESDVNLTVEISIVVTYCF